MFKEKVQQRYFNVVELQNQPKDSAFDLNFYSLISFMVTLFPKNDPILLRFEELVGKYSFKIGKKVAFFRMLTNYSPSTERFYILSSDSYVNLQDFYEIFSKILTPTATAHYVNEMSFLYKSLSELPICIIILMFMRISNNMILTSGKDLIKDLHEPAWLCKIHTEHFSNLIRRLSCATSPKRG